MLLGLLSPQRISGPSRTNCIPMSANSPARVYMCYLCASVTSLPSANSLTPKCRKCLKSWLCNTQCDSTRPETVSANRTSPSSPTNPCSPSANCLNPSASSTKRPKSREVLTSHPSPQQPQQHLLSMLMS